MLLYSIHKLSLYIIWLYLAKKLFLHRDIQPFAEYAVAPFVGAWIETLSNGLFLSRLCLSHPSWVRGLKQKEKTKQ